MPSQIFISYRRKGEFRSASKIVEALGPRLPAGMTIFFDVKRLQSAKDWSDQIYTELNRSNALLAIIGPKWIKAFGRRKDQTDVMLREIEWALDKKRAVLPILVDGAAMPSSQAMPRMIAGLARCQAMTVDRRTFATDIAALAHRIPDLVTEYGDSYSNVYLEDRNTEVAQPAFYAGKWQSVIQLPNGSKATLDFSIREDSLDVDGYYQLVSQGVGGRFTGEYTLRATSGPPGSQAVITGINLHGFVEGLGPLGLLVPLDDKRGDTYVGVSDAGWTFWSKQLEKAW